MKAVANLVLILLAVSSPTLAQSVQSDFTGVYAARIDSASLVIIRQEKNDVFTAEFVSQGRVALTKVGTDRFRVNQVKPNAMIQFGRDNQGIRNFKWMQALPKKRYLRMMAKDSSLTTAQGPLYRYVGNYRMEDDRLRIVKIRIQNGQLTAQYTNEGTLVLSHDSGNRFILTANDLKMAYEFVPDKNGHIRALSLSRSGSPEFVKTSENVTNYDVYGFNRSNGFTRADSLRGKLTDLRTCYDVLFYDLSVKVHTATKSISGNNKIRIKAIDTFDRIQLDLFANLRIEKILSGGTSLAYTREANAVFIQFPTAIEKGTVHEIDITYSGRPQTPDPASMAGGIFWFWDKEGEHWIETVTQGSGASLWWPCKDHLSDKPDSMRISITVPRGLTDISNGRLLRKTELPDQNTRFEWYVSYPITPYAVAMNIGNYTQFSDRYISADDTLTLNYYCLAQDAQVARRIFEHSKPMLALFEKSFGPYPFRKDGFTVMQSIYPMEHQSAVSMGPIFNPINSETFDSLDNIRTMWHECAHEWWGNNVTVNDMADLWINEAFATYAEVLAYEKLYNKAAMLDYLKEQRPGNQEPILGKRDVNDFQLGDKYSKGALVLHTLRNLIDNDSLWFDLLKGLQDHFAFQTVSTADVVSYINDKTRTDYTFFFEQYLTRASIPTLQLILSQQGTETRIRYRWIVDVERFDMRIKVSASENTYYFIQPTKQWKELLLTNVKVKNFKVDTDNFYVNVSKE